VAEANAASPPENRIEFRMGVNLGDVIAEEHDIFGDGVNVAARLEALAEPGGICVSRVVRDQVRDRLDYTFDDLGEQQVKNIARSVRVYRVRDRAVPVGQPFSGSAQRFTSARQALGCSAALHQHEQRSRTGVLRRRDRRGYHHWLSRYPSLFVIARNSCFIYKGRAVDVK
jgi:adenylate cyclase